MKKLTIAVLVLSVLSLTFTVQERARAASCSLPFTLTNGTTADATQVMADLNAVVSCIATVVTGISPGPSGNIVVTGTASVPIVDTTAAPRFPGPVSANGAYVPPLYVGGGAASSGAHTVSSLIATTLTASCAPAANCTLAASSFLISPPFVSEGFCTITNDQGSGVPSLYWSVPSAGITTTLQVEAINVGSATIPNGTAADFVYICTGN